MMENFMIALEIMAKGLAGVFIALIIIAICVWIMQKIFNR